jgi:hypothetical protein
VDEPVGLVAEVDELRLVGHLLRLQREQHPLGEGTWTRPPKQLGLRAESKMRARNGRGTAEYSQSPSVSGLPAAALTSTSTVMATAAEILEAARECCQIYGDAEGVNGVAGGPACVFIGGAWLLAGDRRAGENGALTH